MVGVVSLIQKNFIYKLG